MITSDDEGTGFTLQGIFCVWWEISTLIFLDDDTLAVELNLFLRLYSSKASVMSKPELNLACASTSYSKNQKDCSSYLLESCKVLDFNEELSKLLCEPVH